MRLSTLLLCSILPLVAGCSHSHSHSSSSAPAPVPTVRQISVEIEAYDPLTNLVWENVGVRIVDAWVEWSGLIVENPDPTVWNFTDDFGIAYFTSAEIADAQVGFVEDSFARAVLEYPSDADEAIVLIELSAPGFRPLYVEIDLSWDVPDAFVSIPFDP